MSVVGVKFNDKGKKYFFESGNIDLKENITVIVETEKGLQFGLVVSEPVELPEEKLVLPLKDVLRVATKEDLKQGRSTDSKKKKIVAAVEIDPKGGIKRAYFKKIDDYSSTELNKIFESHISTEASVKTDKWTGYKPLKDLYNIEQIKGNTADFFQ